MAISSKILVYSKKTAREDVSLEPIMGATFSTELPCFGVDSDKIVQTGECLKYDWLVS